MALSEMTLDIESLKVFQEVPDSTLTELLPHSRMLTFAQGQTILAQNSPPGDIYFLCKGRAEVLLEDDSGQRIVLAQINPGEHFGEMSLLTGEPTSASIVAADTCEVAAISQEGFRCMLEQIPHFRDEIINTLSLRLKRTNYGLLEAHNKELALSEILSDRQGKYSKIVGKNREIKKIRDDLKKWAASAAPLYLVGDKGTGKELVARSIHRASPRKEHPFIAVNCEELVAEGAAEKLFGQLGYLELANGGTLMLKNVDVLSPPVLDKMAEFLRHPLVDVRLISSSSEKGYAGGWLQQLNPKTVSQLFANVVCIPALRNRKRDIPELVEHFLNKCSSIHNSPSPSVSKDAMEKLLSYDYPFGNVKELEEVLERALLLAENSTISGEHVFLGKVTEKTGWKYNLLQLNPITRAIQKKIFPEGFQWAVTLVFAYILASCFTGTRFGPPAEALVWSVWWPGLALSIALFGRIYCSVCPLSLIATKVQDRFRLNRPVPDFLKKYDYLLVTFLFLLIFWVEEITDMHHSPVATGFLLLTILAGAVITAIVFQRQTWCRHICPLGGMVGVCSMAAPLELRSNTEVCMNKCTTHSCYKGTDETPGCPVFQHVPFIDNNQVCKLCLKCVRACPNGSVKLNLRPPAQDIWNTNLVNRGMVVFVAAFLAMIAPLVVFDRLRAEMSPGAWFFQFSLFYGGLTLLASFLAWLFVRKRMSDITSLPAVRAMFALVPLALGLHIAYHLQFTPVLPDLTLKVLRAVSGTRNSLELANLGLIQGVNLLVILTGLIISLVCAWKVFRSKEVFEEQLRE